MSVRIRTLLIVGGVLLSLVLALIISAQLIVTRGFEQLEADQARDNIERVNNAVSEEIARLNSTNGDWAYWDDTYQFIEDANPDYIESNLAVETLVNLDVSFMLFANQAQEIVFARGIDHETGAEITLPDLSSLIAADSFFVTREADTDSRSAVVMLDNMPYLVVSRAILTNANQGPARGTLLFGRSMNASWEQSMADSLKMDLSFVPVNDGLSITDGDALTSFERGESYYLHALDDSVIYGYGLIRDIQDNPVLLYRITMDRDIVAQGRSTFLFFALALIGLALLGGVLTAIMLDRTVLTRLTTLRADVEQISASGDLSKRVQPSGNDELAVLGNKLNEMLNALQSAQQIQQENAARLHTLVQNAPVVFWSADQGGILTALDGSELQALTPQPRELLGKQLDSWISYLPIEQKELQSVLKGNTVTTISNRGGQTFSAHCVPLKDESGAIQGVIGVATNISGQVSAEKGLKQANQDLEQKNRQLRRAHEFLRATVEHLRELVQRSASANEMSEQLRMAEREFETIS